MADLLAQLPRYQNEVRDIRGFAQALEDVRWALNDALGEDDILFELGAIATVLRHCSILACYKLGTPRFQMPDSIRISFAAVGMPGLAQGAVDLYRFRLATARQIPSPTTPSLDTATLWVGRAKTFVERVGNL